MAGEDCPPAQPQPSEIGFEPPPGVVEPSGSLAAEGSCKRAEPEILNRFDSLVQLFESKLAYDAFKEGQITRLHSELQEYKSDLLARSAMPLVNGIIRLHDDLGKVLDASRPDAPRLSPERLIHSIEAFRDDLEELLADNGVSTYQTPDGSFDPHRQRALRTVPAPSPDLTGRVAERLRPGFERAGSIVMKERVAVYVAPLAETSGPGGGSEEGPPPNLASGNVDGDSPRREGVS